MTRRGHTLVELLAALVVLEVGLLGAVGTCVLAARLVTRAEVLEWGVAEVQRTLDSLAAVGPAVGQHRQPSGPGELRWRVGGDGAVSVEYAVADSVLIKVEGRVSAAPASGG